MAVKKTSNLKQTDWLGKLTDRELDQLAECIWRERSKREDAECKRDNICPECMGTGFLGSETDHEPCDRCKTTGRYAPHASTPNGKSSDPAQ